MYKRKFFYERELFLDERNEVPLKIATQTETITQSSPCNNACADIFLSSSLHLTTVVRKLPTGSTSCYKIELQCHFPSAYYKVYMQSLCATCIILYISMYSII